MSYKVCIISHIICHKRSHRHCHVGPAPLADFSARAARTDVIVIRQVDVEHQFALYRLKRPWLHREVVLP